jgi:Sec-independent protein translocase protein TatA
MFGFGLFEIVILLGLVILVFGAAKARKMIDTGLHIHREVDKTRQEIRRTFSFGLFDKEKKNSKKCP